MQKSRKASNVMPNEHKPCAPKLPETGLTHKTELINT